MFAASNSIGPGASASSKRVRAFSDLKRIARAVVRRRSVLRRSVPASIAGHVRSYCHASPLRVGRLALSAQSLLASSSSKYVFAFVDEALRASR
jgi:hypothetical protein